MAQNDLVIGRFRGVRKGRQSRVVSSRGMTELTVDAIRALARLQGFEWTDAEIEAIRPSAEAALAMLARLRAVDFGAADPTTQFRIL